jgi:hypothetical protein
MSDSTPTTQQSAPEDTLPQASDSAASSGNEPQVEQAVYDAFTLSWQIVELRSRVQIALYESADSSLRLASLWHANMNRIAALHNKAFPNRDTAQTLYEPPPQKELSYLYPSSPDYADIGIKGTDAQGTTLLPHFRLYDVTRRAINCLTLLYFNKDDSLTPGILEDFQGNLEKAILAAMEQEDREAVASLKAEERPLAAKKWLTNKVVRFLNAWHGYLGENYYVGGTIPNDGLELIAYEAGHYLSRISWDMSVATVPLEQRQGTSNPPSAQEFIVEWQKVFQVRAMVRLQHQITALSSALDDAYYLHHPKQPRLGDSDVLVPLNPDLPSQVLQAVKNSVNYWQRAVTWIIDNENKHLPNNESAFDATTWSKPLRRALTEQANIWQALMTGQQSLRAYNIEAMAQEIMQDVMNEIQANVQAEFSKGITEVGKALTDMASTAKAVIQDVKQVAVSGLDTLLSPIKPYLVAIVGGIVVVAIVFIIIALAVPQFNSALVTMASTGVSAFLTAILGYFGLGNLNTKKEDQQKTIQNKSDAAQNAVDDAKDVSTTNSGEGGLLTRIEGATQEVGTEMIKALNRGYEQIRIELDGLQRSVAVAYPLVEFVQPHFELKTSTAFLTEVIWSGEDREEQLKLTMRAAFGPLALLLRSNPASSTD